MTNRVLSIISAALVVLDMIWFAVRTKKYGIKTEVKENKNFLIKEISIYVCSILIIAIIFLMEFGMIGDIALCGCSVMGVELANRELLDIED